MKSKKSVKKLKQIRFRQSLFWDVDPKTIDPKKHARYIIERILDFGNDREVRWMANRYQGTTIRDILRSSRVIHEKSKSLWNLIYQ